MAQYTIELDRARVLKEQADLAVDSFVQQTSDALPFPVLGTDSPSTTLSVVSNLNRVNGGNGNNGINGGLIGGLNGGINGLTTGSLVNSFSGDLFPFSFFNANVGGGNFNCNSVQGGLTTLEGTIQRIYGNNMMVKGTNGNIYTVGAAPCSKLYSPNQNYNLSVGSNVSLLGGLGGQNVFNLIEGICY